MHFRLVLSRFVTGPIELKDANLKYQRALSLAEDLTADILELRKAGGLSVRGDTRRFEKATSEVQFLTSESTELPTAWSPVIGDIIQNLRAVFDYTWYALATLALGREPTEQEARTIQFPCVKRREDWDGHRHVTHVSREARALAERVQPFQFEDETYLELLVRLSNHDKHRRLHLARLLNVAGGFYVPAPEDCVDCRIPTNSRGEYEVKMNWGNGAFKRIGEDGLLFGIMVEQTGESPDIHLSEAPEFQCEPGITEGDFPLGETLRGLGEFTRDAASQFSPLFK